MATTGISAGMGAARDAIALVRAMLGAGRDEIDRILAGTPNAGALAGNLAYIVAISLRRMPEEFREEIFTAALRELQDNALDVAAASGGPGDSPAIRDADSGSAPAAGLPRLVELLLQLGETARG